MRGISPGCSSKSSRHRLRTLEKRCQTFMNWCPTRFQGNEQWVLDMSGVFEAQFSRLGKENGQSEQGQKKCNIYFNGEATIWLNGTIRWSDVGTTEKSCLWCLAKMASRSDKPGQWVGEAVKDAAVRWKIFVYRSTVHSTMRAQRILG